MGSSAQGADGGISPPRRQNDRSEPGRGAPRRPQASFPALRHQVIGGRRASTGGRTVAGSSGDLRTIHSAPLQVPFQSKIYFSFIRHAADARRSSGRCPVPSAPYSRQAELGGAVCPDGLWAAIGKILKGGQGRRRIELRCQPPAPVIGELIGVRRGRRRNCGLRPRCCAARKSCGHRWERNKCGLRPKAQRNCDRRHSSRH